MLFRVDTETGDGLLGNGGTVGSAFIFAGKLLDEPLVGLLEGGVELPRIELSVEDDFCVGTVPVDCADCVEESVVPKLALDRRLNSLKNVMIHARENEV